MTEELVKKEIAELIAAYEVSLGIHICINDFAGALLKYIPQSNQYHANPYCNFIKNLDAGGIRQMCSGFDNNVIPRQIRLSDRGVWKLCHGELLEYVTRLNNGDVMVGKISFGPYRFDARKHPGLQCVQSAGFTLRDKIDRGMWNLLPAPNAAELAALERVFENLAESLSRQLSRPSVDGCGSIPRRESIDGFLRRRLGSTVELADLAAFLGLSASRTGVVVREIFQMSFAQLLRSLRMEYAKLLLVNTTLPVTRIASLCGYRDPAYFHRCFRKSDGESALQYRRNARRQP